MAQLVSESGVVVFVGTGIGFGGLPKGWTGDGATPENVTTNGGSFDTGGGDLATSGGTLLLNGGSLNSGNGGEVVTALLSGRGGDLTLGSSVDADSNDVTNVGTLGCSQFSLSAAPEVPAIPTAQDVVDALVTLGLVTQAP